jgi:hypothetical protein
MDPANMRKLGLRSVDAAWACGRWASGSALVEFRFDGEDLSARDQEMEKILAFDAGADDYVEKPFAIGELMARLRAALRHAGHESREPAKIEIGPLWIDFVKHLVMKNGVAAKIDAEGMRHFSNAREAGRTAFDSSAIAHCRVGACS